MSKLLNNFISALKSGEINAINKTANAVLVYNRKHPMAGGLLTAEQVIALDYLKSKWTNNPTACCGEFTQQRLEYRNA